MEDKDKIIRHDALDFIRGEIKKCFGSADLIFASHATIDEDRAKEVRSFALKSKIRLQEIYEIALAYLYQNGCPNDQVKEEMDNLLEFFKESIQ